MSFQIRTDDGKEPDELDRELVAALAAGVQAVTVALDKAGVEGSVALIIGFTIRLSDTDHRVTVAQAGRDLEGFKRGPLFTGLARQILEDVAGAVVVEIPHVDPRMN